MDSKFNVLYAGLQEGVTAEDFTAKFCSKFGISEQKAQQIVASGSDIVVKKDLDEKKAKQYAAAFEACGMIVHLDEIAAESAGLSLEPMDEEDSASSAQTASSSPKCPKCGSEQIVGDECAACGIYISKYLESQQKSAVQYESESDIEESTSVAAVSSPVEMSDTGESNPYATPEAALDKSTVSKDGQGSLEGGINGDYDFTIGEIFSEAWERTKGAKWTFLLAWLFYFVIAIVVSALISYVMPDSQVLMDQGRFTEGMIWSILPSLITIPILYPLMAGITLLGIHRAVDADISATSIFSHYRKVIPLTILTIVVYIFTILGLMLMILPGIYLAVAYMMAVALMIDRDMGVWEAMETSRKAITRHWFKVFFLYLFLGLLMFVAMIPALIGLIWVLPLASIMHGVMYKYMFGVESVD